jgi:hypothetical protein
VQQNLLVCGLVDAVLGEIELLVAVWLISFHHGLEGLGQVVGLKHLKKLNVK